MHFVLKPQNTPGIKTDRIRDFFSSNVSILSNLLLDVGIMFAKESAEFIVSYEISETINQLFSHFYMQI